MEFIKTCPECAGQDVQVMSAIKKTVERLNKTYDVVEITEICNQCAHMGSEIHYLYDEETL